jgi:CRISPR-associated protein Csx10
MKTIELTIELKEDTVFSEHAATEGGHKSLHFVPGSTLLGSAAGKLYRQLSHAHAWQVFHSGKIRFTNGYPLSATEKNSYPAPLCWHHSKEDTDTVYNGTAHFKQANTQPKQVRSGFYTDQFELVKVNLASRMKTAIDPKTRMAKDAQLFDYAYIQAGHRFSASIQMDDDIDPNIVDALLKHFNGDLLLGRSRSAEYGKTLVSATLKPSTEPSAKIEKGTLSIWLQSDACLIDVNGQPNLYPNCLSMLDSRLPKAVLELSQSYLRKRQYNVWNAFKKGYDTERHVIVAGSVLTYTLEDQLTSEQQQILLSGIGLYRENGLGQVFVNKPHTTQATFQIQKAETPKPNTQQTTVSHPLVDWLDKQHKSKTGFDSIRQVAKTEAEKLYPFYVSHRGMLGLDESIAVGPSKSQWGSVLAAAKTARSNKSLTEKLFVGADAIVKDKKGWEDKFWHDNTLTSFNAWFKHLCDQHSHDLIAFVQHFAREAQQTLNTTQKGAK